MRLEEEYRRRAHHVSSEIKKRLNYQVRYLLFVSHGGDRSPRTPYVAVTGRKRTLFLSLFDHFLEFMLLYM